MHYEYWQHKALPQTYAIRLEGRQITGIAGPLPLSALRRAALPHDAYDDDPERCRDLERREHEFLLVR